MPSALGKSIDQAISRYNNDTHAAQSSNTEWYGLTFEQFWYKLKPPVLKNGAQSPILPYELDILDALGKYKRLWIKKARGLGITEFFLRYMIWLAHKPEYHNTQMAIVVGPKMDLGVGLINRMKRTLDNAGYKYENTKESKLILNGCQIDAYPSNHTEALRSPEAMKFIFLDEADFFNPNEFYVVITAATGYTAKTNPHIIMVSTPNLPGGQYDQIERGDPANRWHKIFLPYTVGIGTVYTDADIAEAKKLDSFEREYNLKYGYGVGNIFPYQLVDSVIQAYDLTVRNGHKVLGIDPGYGSSKFAVVGIEQLGGVLYIKEAKQYDRPSPSAMLEEVTRLGRIYGQVFVDSAHPGLILDLQSRGIPAHGIKFSTELSDMTVKAAQAVKTGTVKIHPAFNDLAYQLKAIRFNEKGHPNKKEMDFDLGDAFLMAVSRFGFGEIRLIKLEDGIPSSYERQEPTTNPNPEPVWTEEGFRYQ